MIEWYKTSFERRNVPGVSVAFALRFLASNADDQRDIIALWDSAPKWMLPDPWRLACTQDGPESSEERIRTLLLFQALDDDQSPDRRESIVFYAIIYNSCELAGIDPVRVFEEVAVAVNGRVANQLRAFLARDPADQSMDAFLLSAVPCATGGFELRASW